MDPIRKSGGKIEVARIGRGRYRWINLEELYKM
jgi:hypothetical protein